MTWDDVIQLASELPGVSVSASYGTPALRVNGKLLTRLRQEDESLVLLDVPVDEREMLLEADPRVFHITPHYDGYPTVLAYLATLDAETARLFLKSRWRSLAPKRPVMLGGYKRSHAS